MSEKSPQSSRPAGGAKLVLVAFLLAVISVILVNFYIESVRTQASRNTFEVYVLKQSVRAKDKISNKHIRKIEIPDVEGFRESFEALGAIDAVDLKVRLNDKEAYERSASAGEILTYSLFIPPGGKDIDRNIKEGMRQISLPVSSRTAPGVLHEGMYVDIEAAFHAGGMLPKPMPVMERVKIIAIGTRTIYDEASADRGTLRRYNTITIEVKPQEATQLALVQRAMVGDFDLHLRNPTDTQMKKIPDGGINPEVLDLIERRSRGELATDRR